MLLAEFLVEPVTVLCSRALDLFDAWIREVVMVAYLDSLVSYNSIRVGKEMRTTYKLQLFHVSFKETQVSECFWIVRFI